MPIDVIIPFFNRPEHTEVLLKALYETDHGTQIAPILVDNGSRNRSKSLVSGWKEAWKDLPDYKKRNAAEPRIITLDSNRGFAGGVNAGLGIRSGDFVVIMHNDCVPFEGWAGEMLGCFQEADEDVAVVVPRTNYANEHSPCIKDVREQFEKVKPSNKDRILPEDIEKIMSDLYPDRKAFLASIRTQGKIRMTYSPEISSFCMMAKNSMFGKYGMFDEDFWPRGWEDKWWFREPSRHGEVAVVSEFSFVHHAGNTTSDGPGFCWPDISQVNERKFRDKCLERDRKGMKRS